MRIEANRKCSVYMDQDDVVGGSPSTVEFVGRVDFKEHLFALAVVVVTEPAKVGNSKAFVDGCLTRVANGDQVGNAQNV